MEFYFIEKKYKEEEDVRYIIKLLLNILQKMGIKS